MKIAVIAVTKKGIETSLDLKEKFPHVELFAPRGLIGKFGEKISDTTRNRVHFFEGELGSFVFHSFERFDAFIFIMAVGIAVRVLAPCLKHKQEDPAVVVVDDSGKYAVSLLSGHLGGANDLTVEVAESIGALPVITTATDNQGITSFDLWARRKGWAVENLPALKTISSGQLQGKPVLYYAQDKIKVDPPGEHIKLTQEGFNRLQEGNFTDITPCFDSTEGENKESFSGIIIVSSSASLTDMPPGLPAVILRPRNITAGIGARAGVLAARLIDSVKAAFVSAGYSLSSLNSIATVEEKAREVAFQEAARFFGVPLEVVPKHEIAEAEHLFHSSELVRSRLGIGAVAEPCAYLGSGKGEIILEKKSFDGITISLAESCIFTSADDEG